MVVLHGPTMVCLVSRKQRKLLKRRDYHDRRGCKSILIVQKRHSAPAEGSNNGDGKPWSKGVFAPLMAEEDTLVEAEAVVVLV